MSRSPMSILGRVVLPGSVAFATAWWATRYYLNQRDASGAGVHGGRTDRARGRWDWPRAGATSRGRSSDAYGEGGRWGWPTAPDGDRSGV